MIDLGLDEALLEIGVDDASRGRGLVARLDGPGAALVLSGREEGAEAEEAIDGVDEDAEGPTSSRPSSPRNSFFSSSVGSSGEFGLEFPTDDDALSAPSAAATLLAASI